MNTKKTQVAIIGASGYTGLEFIKMMLSHPYFELTYVGTSEGGEQLTQLHPSLHDVFTCSVQKSDAKEIAKVAQLAFLALPHKAAMGFAKDLLALGVKVVDLSADYRLSLGAYEEYYCAHEDKENLKNAVYGLPEINREKIKNTSLVANPGCYPTATLLAVLPFAAYIDAQCPIFIDAKSGVSGAGKKPNAITHFPHVNENIFAYNPFIHRHSPEIAEKIQLLTNKKLEINFVPHLIPVTRGMLVSVYIKLDTDIDAKEHLATFYKDEQFVRVREHPCDIKSTIGTNFCDIFVAQNNRTLFISSSIDNLLRGASSQAVLNANLMCGYAENLGIPTIAYVP